MPAFNNYWANQVPNNQWMNNSQGYNNWNMPQQPQQQQFPVDQREYVHGRAGADAYQLRPGVFMQILWDDEVDRFYIKGYDNNGRPRVLADNDFQPHVEPEAAQQGNLDLSAYATKDDIKNMISEAFANLPAPNMAGYVTTGDLNRVLANLPAPNMNGYVTLNDFNKALGSLSVGSGGRIVRDDEPNA